MTPINQQEYDFPVIDTDSYDDATAPMPSQVKPVQDIDTIKTPQRKHTNKQAKKESNEPSRWNEFLSFFTDKRTHAVIGIGFILFAAYVLIASLSYFVHGTEDQSAITAHSIEQLANNPGTVKNLGGPSGAVLSQVILTNSLGLGAIVMIFYIIMIGLALLRVKKIAFWQLTFKSLLIALTISMVAGLVTYNLDTPFLYGGQHGRWINTLLMNRFNVIGATLVSIFLVSAVVFIYINQIVSFYKAYRRRVEAFREQERQAKLEKEEELRKVKEGVTDDVLTQNDENNDTEPIKPENGVVGFTDTDENETTDHDPYRRNKDNETDEPPIITEEISDDDENEIQEPESGENSENIITLDTGGVTLDVKKEEIEVAENVMDKPFDPTAELSRYHFPPIDILKEYETKANNVDLAEQEENKQRIAKTLKDYGISISKIEATVGPTITLYEIIPVEGTRIQQIKRLGDDLMLSLAAMGIRIIAPIPGKGTIGIEVPNQDPQTVSIRSILSSKDFQECKYELPMAMGATISNKVYIADLAKMPHMLVAGATGQGKSVGLNTIIASLLYKKHPATLKFVLVDPKMVEFSLYSRLENHYLAKLPDEEDAIITSPEKVVNTLNSLCVEMDNRYSLLRDAGCRSVIEYNDKFTQRRLNPEKGHRYMPYIVIIVDEFADLIMTAGKEVETPIARIAQKARAVGMHMIIATQRPSTNVITGIIKANFPGRMAFKVAQGIDSKTILDRPGANQLIGKGDMLISQNGTLERVQCAFISTPEVEEICEIIESQPGYDHAYYLPEYFPDNANAGNAGAVTDRDPLFEEAARIIVQSGTASTSSLQRRYSIGYNRAGKIMDQMEAVGIVGPSMGGKPRQVLMDPMSLERLLESF